MWTRSGWCGFIETFNQGFDRAGREMGQKAGFTIAVACDPTRSDLAQEVDRFHHKVSGGAHFTMTQPIYDPQLWVDFLRIYEDRYGEFPVPVLIGVLPLQGPSPRQLSAQRSAGDHADRGDAGADAFGGRERAAGGGEDGPGAAARNSRNWTMCRGSI